MSQETFKPGDVVVLQSGGPRMTVVAVQATHYHCVWFSDPNGASPPLSADFKKETVRAPASRTRAQ